VWASAWHASAQEFNRRLDIACTDALEAAATSAPQGSRVSGAHLAGRGCTDRTDSHCACEQGKDEVIFAMCPLVAYTCQRDVRKVTKDTVMVKGRWPGEPLARLFNELGGKGPGKFDLPCHTFFRRRDNLVKVMCIGATARPDLSHKFRAVCDAGADLALPREGDVIRE
jgi:hypothetical protein